jgi:hypothetical protein
MADGARRLARLARSLVARWLIVFVMSFLV